MVILQSCVLLEENSNNLTCWKAVHFGIRGKEEKSYYEHNDIQLLLGIETYAETLTLILETVAIKGTSLLTLVFAIYATFVYIRPATTMFAIQTVCITKTSS